MSREKVQKTSPEKDGGGTTDYALDDYDLGVWRIVLAKETGQWHLIRRLKDLRNASTLMKRVIWDLYSLEPSLCVLYFIAKLWSAVQSAILLFLSSQLLKLIEIAIGVGYADAWTIGNAIVKRLFCVAVFAWVEWWMQRTSNTLETRMTSHFRKIVMDVSLRTDLPTMRDPAQKLRVSGGEAWRAFSGIVEYFTEVLTSASQMALIIEAALATGSPVFAVVCTIKPVYCALQKGGLWAIPHIVDINSDGYRRAKAIQALTSTDYRADVLNGGIGGYLINEFERATNSYRGLSDEYPSWQERQKSSAFSVISNLLGDLPMVYCAYIAVMNPSNFSVSSIAILQQSADTLRWSLTTVLEDANRFFKQIKDLQSLYEAGKSVNQVVDGVKPYPDPSQEKQSLGMSFELRDVSFEYPGSKSTTTALKNINLSIKAGQLVVFVGANGSGKSTIINLLSRMYDPTSGEILVDGTPLREYSLGDIRQAIAVLSQNNNLFPLSLAENIGLGNVEHVHNTELINAAVEKGGANVCVSRLENGLDTVLDPLSEAYGLNLVRDDKDPLVKELARLDKKVDVSGGERQRLVAARTFMRFTTGRIKFVAVDEPSSALDAEGEIQLFDNLRSSQEGKTMIFVTHRFGHLTRYADLIVCMKDGKIVESGKHSDLMKMEGEYAKLYNIQASAFMMNS